MLILFQNLSLYDPVKNNSEHKFSTFLQFLMANILRVGLIKTIKNSNRIQTLKRGHSIQASI